MAHHKIWMAGAAHLVTKRWVGPFWHRWRWLQRTQWLSGGQLEQLQIEFLRRLLRHCYHTVPFYRDIMDRSGVAWDDVRNLADLQRLPVLTKTDVLRAGGSIVSTRYPRFLLRRAYTGGTTGMPLVIWRDVFSIANNHAFYRRQKAWGGVGLRDKCAYLTGRLVAKPDQRQGRLYAYDPFMKELVLSTYHLSRDTAGDYVKAIKEYDVRALDAYPSAAFLLARTCLDAGLSLRLNAVFTSSETLTESMRRTIADAFGCPVYDYYGSAERSCIVHTCERGSYHLIPEYGVAELYPVVPEDQKRCRIISTGFWNKAMPLIRYDTGDVVVKSDRSCPCGRAYPVIESVSGRQGDVIKTRSGREFGAAILTHLLYGTDHILESQIIQDGVDHVTIEYVPSAEFAEADLASFRGLIVQHLPSELKVDLKEVAAVQRTKDGKIRPIVSAL